MDEIRLNSHAKINLSLRITGRRPDGYHEIVSFMQGIGLHDVVTIKKCTQNATKYNLPHCTINGIVVYLCLDAKTIPTDMSNLALKGVKAFTDACAAENSSSLVPDRGADSHDSTDSSEGPGSPGSPDCAPDQQQMPDTPDALLIEIGKRLPVAAGIAGGSGNAAVCMLGLNELAGSPFTLRELMEAGTAVGADVPFSIFMNAYRNRATLTRLRGIEEAADSAWTSGIGDIVEAAGSVPAYVLLANPGVGVSTRAAYEAMDSIGYDAAEADPGYARELFTNDLEKYTLAEESRAAGLKRIMEESLNADKVLMSGSGPTIAAYYEDEKTALSDMKKLTVLTGEAEGTRIWITDSGIKDI